MSLLTADRYLNSTIDSEGQVDHDERLDIKTIYNSWSGILTTVTSAVISIIASAVVIRLICRSAKGIKKSVYHRILFGMSAADIVQSLALALTTLPMPKDMIYTNFQGIILGNDATCLTQGFVVSFGAFTGLMYNAMLSLYYLCSIRYYMSNEDFARWIEPLLHGVSVVSGLTIASLLVSYKSYHPSPLSTSWCGIDKYPYWCTEGDCDGFIGSGASGALVAYFTLAFSLITFCILVSSMVLIVITVRGQQLRMNNMDSASTGNTKSRVLVMQTHILANTTIVMKQAIAYTLINVFGFVMIVVLPYVRSFNEFQVPSATFQIFFLILRPLQGLLNSIIFIYHKASSLQRAHPTFKFSTAVGKVLKGEEEEGDGRVVSDLLILRQHSALGRLRFAYEESYESSAAPTALDKVEGKCADQSYPSPDDSPQDVEGLEMPSQALNCAYSSKSRNELNGVSIADASGAGSAQDTLTGFSIYGTTASGSSMSENDLSSKKSLFPVHRVSIKSGTTGTFLSSGEPSSDAI